MASAPVPMRWLIFALHTLVITAVARQGTTNLPQSHPTKRDESMGNDKSATDITDTRLPYGWKISSCTEAGTVALTFDDGPYEWTRTVAEKMDDAGFKATFFFIGKTYKRKLGLTRRMDDERTEYPDLLRSLHKRGHQLASHTWTHADLDALGREDRQQQMLDNEEAFRNVLGFMPTYMRPPKGHCGTACLEDMKTLKYHTIWWDINPEDWKYNSEDTWNETIMRFDRDLSAGGSIAVSHDVELYTVEKLLPHMISELKKRGLASVTVGECLGDLEENWYRSGRRK